MYIYIYIYKNLSKYPSIYIYVCLPAKWAEAGFVALFPAVDAEAHMHLYYTYKYTGIYTHLYIYMYVCISLL